MSIPNNPQAKLIPDPNNPQARLIEVCGVIISRKHYPILYRMARRDLLWLETNVKSVARMWHEGDCRSALQSLESDLEHSNPSYDD